MGSPTLISGRPPAFGVQLSPPPPPTPKVSHLIFVYGTLRKGHGNHYLLRGAKMVNVGQTAPAFTMFSLGGFPAVVEGGTTAIEGEVYQVDSPRTLMMLDALENHPDWYRRTAITLPVTGQVVEIYLMQLGLAEAAERYAEVPSGNWNDR